MKQLVPIVALMFISTILSATPKEVAVEVSFENLTNENLTSGTFYVLETNQSISVFNEESFEVLLPQNGKYHFVFVSENFRSFIKYPIRITDRNREVTIRLRQKSLFQNVDPASEYTETEVEDELMEEQIRGENLNFVMHGLDNSIPDEYVIFKEKYGVGLIKQNCVVYFQELAVAVKNNQRIAAFLNRKYGENWRAELRIKPAGI